jgi:hypothetical protein
VTNAPSNCAQALLDSVRARSRFNKKISFLLQFIRHFRVLEGKEAVEGRVDGGACTKWERVSHSGEHEVLSSRYSCHHDPVVKGLKK